MAVGFVRQGRVFVLHVDVEEQAAVAALVGVGHVLQDHPEAVLHTSNLQPQRQAVVAMGVMADGHVARAGRRRAALVAVRREEPAAPQDVVRVGGGSSLVAQQFDGGALRTGVVQVGGRHAQGGVAVGHMASGWKEKTGKVESETLLYSIKG